MLERRPHTTRPTTGDIIELSSEQIRAMSDEQLRWFCEQNGIATKPGWARSKVLQALLNGCLGAADY